jgi:hypothetical protein
MPEDWRSHLLGMSSLGERMWVLLQVLWDHVGRHACASASASPYSASADGGGGGLSLEAVCEYVQCGTDCEPVHASLRQAESAMLVRAQVAVHAAAAVSHLTGAHAMPLGGGMLVVVVQAPQQQQQQHHPNAPSPLQQQQQQDVKQQASDGGGGGGEEEEQERRPSGAAAAMFATMALDA